jgi:hypothetical protein
VNLFEEEPLILARLKAAVATIDPAILQSLQVASAARVTPVINVTSAASIIGTIDISHLLPLIAIQPADSDAVDSSGDFKANLEDRNWLVMVAVGHVPDPTGLSRTYAPHGKLLGLIYNWLAGWTPGPGFKRMRYGGRAETQIAPGHIEFPMRFAIRRGVVAAQTTNED